MAEETKQEKSKFVQNEIVLCYEPDPLKAKMLYEAKVLDIDVTKDENGKIVSEYYVHFQGWNKNWDRWVLEDQILKNNDASRALQSRLYQKAIQPRKRKRQSTRSEQSDDADDKDDDKSSTSSESSDEEEEIKMSQLPRITLDIPKPLATRLEDDCYNIKRKKKLIRLPRKPNVKKIFQNYYTHCEQLLEKGEFKNMSLQMVEECLEGLYVYFVFYLETLLLYQFEREQYSSFFPWKEKPNFTKTFSKVSARRKSHQQTSTSKDASSFVSTKSSVGITKTENINWSLSSDRTQGKERKPDPLPQSETSDSSVSKRLRSSSVTQQPQEEIVAPNPKEIVYEEVKRKSIFDPPEFDINSTVRETRSATTKKLLEKQEQNKQVADTPSKEVKSLNVLTESRPSKDKAIELSSDNDSIVAEQTSRLRRSARVQKIPDKSSDAEDSDVLPMGSTAKTINETVSKKGVNKENLRQGMKKSDVESTEERSFMFFPQTLNGESPADIYGAEHLLRLFVKLPVLVAASNIEEVRVNAILRYVSHFLGYLASNSIDIFEESVYSESAI